MNSALAFLASAQNADGGWGYALRHASAVEPTSAAVLALRALPAAAETLSRALAWLQATQRRDGGWGMTADDDESGWHTAWAVLALRRTGDAPGAVQRGAAWLLQVRRAEPGADSLEAMRQVLEIDVTLRGWPWLPAEATWVEPTALAMLALVGAAAAPETEMRLEEGVRYLANRRCRGGGWNVGNPVMFSQALPPRACPTAWALLALAEVARDSIYPEDLRALRHDMHADGGALALGWGLLALRTLGEDDEGAAAHLTALQQGDGSWNGNPYHTAVAVMASRGSL